MHVSLRAAPNSAIKTIEDITDQCIKHFDRQIETSVTKINKLHCVRKKVNPTQCTTEMLNLNASCVNFVCFILRYSVKYAQNFIWNYCLTAELSIFIYQGKYLLFPVQRTAVTQRVEPGSGQLLTKRSSSGIHVFELAFEHTEDILNIAFRHVWYLHKRTL